MLLIGITTIRNKVGKLVRGAFATQVFCRVQPIPKTTSFALSMDFLHFSSFNQSPNAGTVACAVVCLTLCGATSCLLALRLVYSSRYLNWCGAPLLHPQ